MKASQHSNERLPPIRPNVYLALPKPTLISCLSSQVPKLTSPTGCSNALLYSFLNSEDPGTLNIAQAYWAGGEDIGRKVMPMIHLDDNKDWNDTGKDIPDWGLGAQEGADNCKRVCGMIH